MNGKWLNPDVARALEVAEMDPQSLALYVRWWQLETWLRQLSYVELRSLLGASWADPAKAAIGRQQRDAIYTHMTGIDNENPLAYLDYSQLVAVISEYWNLFGYALLEKDSWSGRQAELRQIRHRIGHLRKPHEDDLSRLEQTLRDLERGTFVALASYNARRTPTPAGTDPVTKGWIHQEHPVADLIDHADRQYDVRLNLTVSRRPWASWPASLDKAVGILWHAEFYLGRRTLEARTLWEDSYVIAVRPMIVHLLATYPSHVEFTFSASDDGSEIADAIGNVLQAVLHSSRLERGAPDLADVEQETEQWRRRANSVDYRVLSGSGWNIVDESTIPISNFGTGGSVRALPQW